MSLEKKLAMTKLDVTRKETIIHLTPKSDISPSLSNSEHELHNKCSLPYFFGYRMGIFPFRNNPTDLDPSCKMDLDLWDCLGRVKLVL